ncbi:Bcl2 modifying factor S homeolog [Xenopus laevis]|uniref:Bcl2 modifying factor S homeolog n=2 Tax=Xenopus laevis TaxID=8355 RepID=A0A8J0Q5F0_XENLA|nr:Bcl2 modifying factor S homeolog [Xenopus laevis]
MEQESYLNMDELDDDVFYPDAFGYPDQTITSSSLFNQSQSYTCLLGRFHLFPFSHCCGPGCRGTDNEDKATQTLGSPSQDIMLPCGVSETPQRLFYGKEALSEIYRMFNASIPHESHRFHRLFQV